MSVCAKLLQSCLTLCDAMDCSPPGSFVHGVLQARRLKWVAIPFSKGSSQPRDWTCVPYVSRTGRWSLYHSCLLGSPMSHGIPPLGCHLFCQNYVCAFFSMFLCVVVDYIFYCCIVFHDINIPMFLYLAYHWWIFKLFSLMAITNYITIIFFVHVLLCMFAWSIISVPRYIPHKNL